MASVQCSFPPRRKKSAADRRSQYLRAQARVVKSLLSSFDSLAHRGSQHSHLSQALASALISSRAVDRDNGAHASHMVSSTLEASMSLSFSASAPPFVPASAMASPPVVHSCDVVMPEASVPTCTPSSPSPTALSTSNIDHISGGSFGMVPRRRISTMTQPPEALDPAPWVPTASDMVTPAVAADSGATVVEPLLRHDGDFISAGSSALDGGEPIVHSNVSDCDASSESSFQSFQSDLFVSDLHGDVRFIWFQSKHHVVVQIFIDSDYANRCEVQFSERDLSVGVSLLDGYVFDGRLRHYIQPAECSWDVDVNDSGEHYVKLWLVKAHSEIWTDIWC
mmetsp:Transcript_74973/g.160532  ORF Transcript_74973/g.160532 Transcript_74973/m.160532 type:complete len:337 (+) Transcript_74973:1-1011(+)